MKRIIKESLNFYKKRFPQFPLYTFQPVKGQEAEVLFSFIAK